ncbi:MAG: tyrosine-type recombinase/integrase [Actinomycetota bacterium]|nr:tyrosine-type recombinase/integrase [Actinomycetota bacterium]
MPSVWVERRETAAGRTRYLVKYRLGGRESVHRYAGSFGTRREAHVRRSWVAGELAAMRVPNISSLQIGPTRSPTVAEACERWRAARVDVAEATRVLHRVALGRVLPILGDRRLDELTVDDVNALIVELDRTGRRRETIRKSVKYLAAVLEENGIEPNPARDKRARLPHAEPVELEPPTSEHVEAVIRLLVPAYRLPLLWLDWSGARVASIETALVGDYDELGRRVRLRASTTKTRAALWVELPDALAEAIEATLRPRDDRDAAAPLFPGVTADRLRTAIARACRAAGVPVFSPHDLRHRRISLLHRQGRTWAEIGRLVGQRKLSITADTYTHVLSDGRELDFPALVSELIRP